MAENKQEVTATSRPAPRSASPREVFAARLKAVQDAGLMTPKMQRNFDRMLTKIEKGNR